MRWISSKFPTLDSWRCRRFFLATKVAVEAFIRLRVAHNYIVIPTLRLYFLLPRVIKRGVYKKLAEDR